MLHALQVHVVPLQAAVHAVPGTSSSPAVQPVFPQETARTPTVASLPGADTSNSANSNPPAAAPRASPRKRAKHRQGGPVPASFSLTRLLGIAEAELQAMGGDTQAEVQRVGGQRAGGDPASSPLQQMAVTPPPPLGVVPAPSSSWKLKGLKKTCAARLELSPAGTPTPTPAAAAAAEGARPA